MTARPIRLFIAAAIPETYRPVLSRAQRTLAHQANRVSLTKADNLHLTLCFIGEVATHQLSELRSLFFDWAAERESAYSCAMERYGTFKGKDGLTVWAGLDVDEALTEAVDQLRRRLSLLGYEVDMRPWLAHLTIARRYDSPVAWHDLKNELPLPDHSASIDQISLYQSEFTPNGMRYTALETWHAKA